MGTSMNTSIMAVMATLIRVVVVVVAVVFVQEERTSNTK
jgi:hypothetical protein